MNEKLYVRQSSVKEFAVCPLRWYFREREREKEKEKITHFGSGNDGGNDNEPLWAYIGNGFHKFMELSMVSGDYSEGAVKKFLKGYCREGMNNELLESVCLHYVLLSPGFKKTYFSNENLQVVKVNGSWSEIHFEIPITSYQGVDIIFSGTIDGVVKSRRDGRLWVVDHKTVSGDFQSALRERASYAVHEVQSGFYLYALKKMGLEAAGIIYNLVGKFIPENPPLLKSGEYSKKKTLKTCDVYLERWINECGLDMNDWEEQMNLASSNRDKFFRRVAFERSAVYVASMEDVIVDWGKRMVDERKKSIDGILHNGGTHCFQCSFREECLSKVMRRK